MGKIHVHKGIDPVTGAIVCHIDGNLIREGRFYDGDVLYTIDGNYIRKRRSFDGEVVYKIDGNLIRKGIGYEGNVIYNIDGKYIRRGISNIGEIVYSLSETDTGYETKIEEPSNIIDQADSNNIGYYSNNSNDGNTERQPSDIEVPWIPYAVAGLFGLLALFSLWKNGIFDAIAAAVIYSIFGYGIGWIIKLVISAIKSILSRIKEKKDRE